MAPSAKEEAAFMAQLLQGLDNSFSSPKTQCNRVPQPIVRTPSKPSATNVNHELDMADFLQGSENWDLDDLTLSPIKPATCFTVSNPSMSSPPYVPDQCTRCVVEIVLEEYVAGQWRKSITARVDPGEERVNIYLYDDWYHTDVGVGDYFNAIGSLSTPAVSFTNHPRRSISITSQSNLLILHPDILLTATALSSASQCTRKPLLSSLVHSSSDTTPALVWGSMLHEVIQKCLLEQRWDQTFIQRCVDEAVLAGLGDLVKVGLNEDVAQRELQDRATGLKAFQEKYLHNAPKDDAKLMNTRSMPFQEPSLLAITKVHDVEEDIWSPTYGLKGKIDVTIQGTISDPIYSSTGSHATNPLQTAVSRKVVDTPLPLEIKTGRAIAGMEHRAQTMLYTLLLSERYGVDVQDGLLFYTQSEGGEVIRVPRGRNEIRGLIAVRNEIAAYMWKRLRNRKSKKESKTPTNSVDKGPQVELAVEKDEPFLPPPIDDERICKRCYVQDACFLFRKTHPNHSLSGKTTKFDPPIPGFLSGIFEAKTGHLTTSQIQFFRDWERLLAMEERELMRFKKELWTLGAEEREKLGRCFSGMFLVHGKSSRNRGAALAQAIEDTGIADYEEPSETVWNKEGKIHRWTYTFARSKRWTNVTQAPTMSQLPTSNTLSDESWSSQSLLNGHLNVGDPVTVSAVPLLALTRGYILELTPTQVVLGVDHVLDVAAIRNRLRREPSARNDDPFEASDEEVIFRIDKDELFGGMARVRNNLAQLFYADGDRRRLELVVDLRKPIFSKPDPPFCPAEVARASSLNLNPSQLSAMEKVLSAEDYALILGMPGTGKTTVIAALIKELVARGKTVLLTSYTHSAVDTILMKLTGEGGKDTNGAHFGILRLGNVDKVHLQMRKYTLNAIKVSTVEQFERQIMSPPVVATTCLSIDHPLFARRNFDYCIVDEASQITLPTCLGPLSFAHKFILVGDHHQLPPVVRNMEARKEGLDVSLFRRLSEARPEAVVDLLFQYRMNADIMLLSNKLIYNNRLSCGCDEVANRTLKLPNNLFLKRSHSDHGLTCGTNCWLEALVNESCRAVFVDTDAIPALDSRAGDLVQNATEAELVRQLAETLIRSGVDQSQIGILSLYRQQVKLLQHLLRDRQGVEVLTADRSQGRDKDCIIISLVRSNEDGKIGDLVKDWRRMNVSFTRARAKLVIFGSRKTLQREPLLARFFKLMQEHKWILHLPPGSDSIHTKIFGGTVDLPSVAGVQGEDEVAPKVGQKRRLTAKENARVRVERHGHEKEAPPAKKIKIATNAKDIRNGLLSARPILQDLVANEIF